MRGKRMIVCLCVVAWGVATNGVVAGEKSGLRSARSAAPAIDPDGPPIMALESFGSTAASAGGCDTVGAFLQPFPGTNRFRGVVYRITRNATLLEFKMQLRFSGTTDLYLSIHRAPSGQQLADFERVLPDVVLRDVLGGGVVVSYSSDILSDPITGRGGLKLQAGFDYAIGVTWGDSASVTYARDQQPYPLPFSQGSVLGLVALGGPPPLEDVLSSLSVFGSNGVYAQELCFAGACCGNDGTCEERSLADCTPGQATAPGVTCDDVAEAGGCPLPQAACCQDGGCFNFNRFFCEASGGVSRAGVLCDDVDIAPCDPRGGCCLPNGDCAEDVTEARCGLIRGSYRGDGVGCAASPDCALGACCSGDACTPEVSRTQCEGGTGVFVGPGTSCSVDSCVAPAPTGACCLQTTCENAVTESDCGVQGGNYRGDDTTCGTISPPCGSGACCRTGVGCVDANGAGITRSLCDAVNGTFRGDGSLCSTISPRCEGLCCEALCLNRITPEDCVVFGGRFGGYTQFCPFFVDDPDPCAGPAPTTGACCLSGNGCTTTTAVLCGGELLGAYQGDGTVCSPTLCVPVVSTGACCTGTGVSAACADGVAEIDCPGRWTEAANCLDVPSPCEVRGSCCDGFDPNNPSCRDDELEGNCQNVGESFTAGTACADLFPPCEPIGSCCDANVFQCLDDVVEAACAGAGRVWDTNFSCNQLPRQCVAPGACCLTTPGTCADLFEDECTGVGEVFSGSGTDCFPNPCLNIVSTNPADCAIDARQPVNVDGSAVNGSDGIDMTFDGSVRGLSTSDFLVESFPGVAPTPEIASVLPGADANSVRVVFNAIMVTQDWTCVTHVASGQRTCVGFLPGDVDGNLLVELADEVTAVAACSDSDAACGVWSCDTDRSGSCTPADILREIDLLNSAGSLGVSVGNAIDPCPVATTP